ncbi:hypothetical protein [Trichormus variabilis]|uniref:Uncharacterized protein n=1 Tax=Trichormus variabilis SAG 1403-4b TaxID=447716 RepID=A0A433UQ56_ANAVA|nr:hypothetical protein [Trichormus variabilis]MBD2626486.1 hypothetical protein [Trichormus variabilis FACHB-164]RUS95971.1 hypothetical protein DSM107003_26330 [Trichormus variabilis SAG 1403-4b]
MLNPFGAFEQGFLLSQKAFDYLKEWNTEAEMASNISLTAQQVVEILVNVPGMTMAHSRDFQRATPLFTLKDQTLVKIFINAAHVKHIFLADHNNKMVFGGYVGLIHTKGLNEAIDNIKKEFS